MILDNRQITIRKVSDDIGILFDLCQDIYTDVLDMKCAAAKIALKLINLAQKQLRMDIAQKILRTFLRQSRFPQKVHSW